MLEVLVAVIILGLTITTLFQLISGSSKLNLKIRTKIANLCQAEQIWQGLQYQDVRAADFPWQGNDGPFTWELVLSPVQPQEQASSQSNEHEYKRASALYKYTFLYKDHLRVLFKFQLYKDYPLNFFSPEFLEEHNASSQQDS